MKEIVSIICGVLLFSLSVFAAVKSIEKNIVAVISDTVNSYPAHTVILDAGHGGEDCGAIAADGTFEKDLNLEICSKISTLFCVFGINHINVRTEDMSVGDTTLNTIRERKVSDIKTRFSLINSTENAVFLSIHQNNFPVEKYFGLQVFYASTETSDRLADFIQSSVVGSLQKGNSRKIKKCDKSVYLLDKAKVPSVMVECGFLSNNEELKHLKDDIYQMQLSYFITKGLMRYLSFDKEV